MKFLHLQLCNLRNFAEYRFESCSNFNFIVGENGVGKTTILEALYLLSLARSFRTHLIRRLVRKGADKLTLYATMQKSTYEDSSIGLEKSLKGETRIRRDGQEIENVLELAQHMPTQILDIERLSLLTASPKDRRQFFDWGLFHVEHHFLSIWRDYSSVLKQRNAALRANLKTSLVTVWDELLIERGQKLHELRIQYLQYFQNLLIEKLTELSFHHHIEVDYSPGWACDSTFSESLRRSLARDQEIKYTQVGPHRFDVRFTYEGHACGETLSRGQLKFLTCTINMVMHQLIHEQTGKNGVLLIDDLPSELDKHNFNKIMEALKKMNCQVFVTGIEAAVFSNFNDKDSQTIILK